MPAPPEPLGRGAVAAAWFSAASRLLAVLVIAWGLFYFRMEIKQALQRVNTFEAFGVKLTTTELAQWASNKGARREAPATSLAELQEAYDRAYRNRSLFEGARALWVDDHPENNLWERRALRSLGMEVDVTLNNVEALDRLRRNEYEVLITDLGRDDPADKVTDLFSALRAPAFQPPYAPSLMIYTGSPGETPPGALARVTQPDILLRVITDALFQRRA
jgi:CheY-like chemotaxis protein